MQLTTSPLDLTDPVPIFILPVVSQSLYWPLRSVSLPEVFFTSPVDPLVGSGITRPVFLPTVLIATLAGSPPKTMTKEWQEASNERARELNLDPITGKCPRRSISPPRLGFSTPFSRCSVRGLFRKRFRAIQVDSGAHREDPGRTARNAFRGFALYSPIIKWSFFDIPHLSHVAAVRKPVCSRMVCVLCEIVTRGSTRLWLPLHLFPSLLPSFPSSLPTLPARPFRCWPCCRPMREAR